MGADGNRENMTHSTPSKPATCKRCQANIWDIHVNGLRKKLDVQPHDLLAELEARRAGRRTYQIQEYHPTFIARLRTPANIADTTPETIVLSEHLCHALAMIEPHPDYWPRPTYIENQEALF